MLAHGSGCFASPREIMPLRKDSSCSAEEVPSFYESLHPHWPGVDTQFRTPFLGHTAYSTEPLVPSAILTPISLPDSSFHPSPALGHHSPEYASQDYRYSLSDTTRPRGLGISAPFPSEYPRTTAPNANYVYAPDDLQYNLGESPSISPHGPPRKQMKRTLSQASSHDTPINILPNPEGIERIEKERRKPRPPPTPVNPRPRAPGRGRRDPQAEAEDAFVEELRNQNTAWKVVREKFRERFKKDASEARLQMRLLRRRERLLRWDEQDIQCLLSAAEMWEAEKYRFISEKMKQLGSTKDYSPDICKAQLKILEDRQREARSISPSALSDSQQSPTLPPSRKRARLYSQEPE